MRRREEFSYYFRKACQHKNVFLQIVDVVHHKLRINTSWEDYYRYQFFDGKKTWNEKSRYIGTLGSRYWPYEGNSLKFERIFELKSIQKPILQAGGFPTPEILLKAGLNSTVNSPEKFASELEKIKVPFLTKADGGAQGAGIMAFQPGGDGYLCDGETVDATWIWRQYEQSIERGFLVETRMDNHPLLEALYSHSLNTVRFMTIKTADGKWHIAGSFLKLGRNRSYVDNLSAGGLSVGLDGNGVSQKGYCRSTRTFFDRHPDTHYQIEGFRVPFYEEAAAMALDASRLFGFMATIGWDIGVTADGPTIIEGNLAWGINGIQELYGPLLSQEVAAGLAPRNWWTPWDKTHFYPDSYKYNDGGWWQRKLARRRKRWQQRLQVRRGQAPSD